VFSNSKYNTCVYNKPAEIFDREAEWAALDRFVSGPSPGAALGLVYGRRRQGKTMLLELLCEAAGGFYFSALEQSAAQNLDYLGQELARYKGLRAALALGSWQQAVEQLFALGEGGQPRLVVIDELPYLTSAAPELPSLLQATLTPARRRRCQTRLILCGSAFSVMAKLTQGAAPLRGRSSIELIVHPFDFRQSARFWRLAPDWALAFNLHALCGGTPAYRDYAAGDLPDPKEGLGPWVVRHLLDPSSPFFREGRVLVAEEGTFAEPQLYLSVLAAVAQGRTRPSQIAGALGRKETSLGRALAILEETRLLARVPDPLRQRRATYQVAEPMVRFHQLLIAPNQARLSRGQGARVWAESASTLSSHIYGPHFETLAREWTAIFASPETLGGTAQKVGSTQVPCSQHKVHHEVDVVALSGQRVIAIGEAKATPRPISTEQLAHLAHLRDLLPRAGGARILLFSFGGFSPELADAARHDASVELVGLERLYAGS